MGFMQLALPSVTFSPAFLPISPSLRCFDMVLRFIDSTTRDSTVLPLQTPGSDKNGIYLYGCLLQASDQDETEGHISVPSLGTSEKEMCKELPSHSPVHAADTDSERDERHRISSSTETELRASVTTAEGQKKGSERDEQGGHVTSTTGTELVEHDAPVMTTEGQKKGSERDEHHPDSSTTETDLLEFRASVMTTDGQKKGSVLYVDKETYFIYRQSSADHYVVYLRCRKDRCKARGVLRRRRDHCLEIRQTRGKGHNHPYEPLFVAERQFRKVLCDRARKGGAFREIYDEEKLQ